GLWLAHAGLTRHSVRTLFGRHHDVERPHLYMMQPYDPQRHVIVMLHGLASSPEAWVNLANEVLGDEILREHFQVWQVYYPTYMPISFTQDAVRGVITDTLRAFDPGGRAPASRDMVLIGHSMGGVVARLLVSSSGDRLWNWVREDLQLDDEKVRRTREELAPMLHFESLAVVGRAIFIAAPHRGTDAANRQYARWIAKFVRLPQTIMEEFEEYRRELGDAQRGKSDRGLRRVPNSIDSLNEADPFLRVAATLPISPSVRYHSIIARTTAAGPLEQSGDGLVPYWSAHLEGAESEKVIVSGHRVQETPAAVLEIRRILHAHIEERILQQQQEQSAPQ
ncbi:MAG: alpha/beta fold hydrolase, partial [Steroidobacteraceae bacterium]